MMRRMRLLCAGGDKTLAEWETTDVSQARLDEIQREFNEHLAKGGFAADITDGKDELIREFNPDANILLVPRCSGGC